MPVTNEARPLVVGIDRSLERWAAEISYVFRTLLRVAGYPYHFKLVERADIGDRLDIYYGPGYDTASDTAAVTIRACGLPFGEAPNLEPRAAHDDDDGLTFLEFEGLPGSVVRSINNGLIFDNDIVFASYWLLTGAREWTYSRDARDNFQLDGSFVHEHSLLTRPLVSIYGDLLRQHFRQTGNVGVDPPWRTGSAEAAFVLSHDVDYPEIIRWIECLRLARERGPRALKSILSILRGTNHFWKFTEWVEFDRRFGPGAFYFMARQGSLLEYATGTPDGFYDIRRPRFGELFQYLTSEGFEIGLHASYHAHRSVEQLRLERTALEAAAGVPVQGNRQHYWHLDPLNPDETLERLEHAGFVYDSSLAFDFYPGFRRGICHPFHPFHSGKRQELNLVQLPPTWMDDHFDRRLRHNGITDPVRLARQLVDVARYTQGVVVVNYHVRGMNRDFYPRYGQWLEEFMQHQLDAPVAFHTPRDLVRMYIEYEQTLSAQSCDLPSDVSSTKVAVA